MAFVEFWKLPAAQYNAEEHGNGIFQCSNDPERIYLFGRPLRLTFHVGFTQSEIFSTAKGGGQHDSGIVSIFRNYKGSNDDSNDFTYIYMDDLSTSMLSPSFREKLPEVIKSLYQTQSISDKGIFYIMTTDNGDEPIVCAQMSKMGSSINLIKAIFLMDPEGNQYFNKVTGDSFHLKETPTTTLNDLADTDIPCAKQVKDASLIDPTLPSPYISSFDESTRTYNLAVDDGTVPDQWVLKIAGRANRAQASNSFVLTEEEYQLLQGSNIQLRPVQLMITKNGKYSLPSNIQFGGERGFK